MPNQPSKITGVYKITPQKAQRMSRYMVLRRLTNTEGRTYIETPVKWVLRETNKDTYYSVETGYENRLDLISYKFYGNPFLWWAIAQINNIDNPMKVKAGLVLRIPDISSLYYPGGVLYKDNEVM